MKYSSSGWLFQEEDYTNNIRDISEQELFTMLDLVKEDDQWRESVHDEVVYRSSCCNGTPTDFLLDQIRVLNIAGTVVSYPFGDALTFGSTRHFFRGEHAVYDRTVPSLNRKIMGLPARDQELYRAIANMRIEQFSSFLWSLNITPRWTATLCDINYMALAQHYGFETHLLDLTNDFRAALFFATNRFDPKTGFYYPLSKKEIEKSEKTQYGVIFHAPNWTIDFFQPLSMINSKAGKSMLGLSDVHDINCGIDSGDWDGIAFQIGFQPFLRCHSQSGFVFPMREDAPLQKNNKFEKLRFKQSPKLSEKVYELMDEGKKIFPFEGLSEARPILTAMQNSWTFSEDDLNALFDLNKVDLALFSNAGELKKALSEWNYNGKSVQFVSEKVDYYITSELIDKINAMYDSIDFQKEIGGMIRIRPEHRKHREEICAKIYGEFTEEH